MVAVSNTVWEPLQIVEATDDHGNDYMVVRRRGTLGTRFVDVDMDLALLGLALGGNNSPKLMWKLFEDEAAPFIEALLKAKQ